ncbi:hypothetical protein EUX98_g5773 [Antrodiella citrinella]|uniref:Uncharacterized protein n=1 Tax=Antrodiella citrinella TaxID=2447956 RepID=A0A4S4MSS9_9APHY|nr:hypothetical protein EUX98_g5773 [Antrodiella citrinella]
MSDYTAWVSSMQDEISDFKKRQRHAVQREEAREDVLLKEWQEGKKTSVSDPGSADDGEETRHSASASLSGTI